MKQGQYLMLTKRKFSLSSNLTSPTNYPSSYDDSWEEQAFAKDAAGSDCIWPPRSYSCSFCKREFRSAQALGGHMNIHRRDRARLKQSSSPPNYEILSHDLETTTHPHNNPAQNSFTSLGYLYPSSLSGLDYSSNPNSDPSQVLASPSKVLATSVNKNCREKTTIPLYNSSILHGCHEISLHHSSKSWSKLAENCRSRSHKFDPEAGIEKISMGLDPGCRNEGDSDETNVAVSLNLFVCRTHPPVQFETRETDVTFKKRKTDGPSVPFLSKSSSVDRHHLQSQMYEFSPSSMEELDLELRLGYKTKTGL